MTESTNLPLQALPDGGAELRLVLRLHWEDVAALGQEAGRLAAQLRRPVSLDEAASHKLRTRSAAAAPLAAVPERTDAAASGATVSALPPSTSGSSSASGAAAVSASRAASGSSATGAPAAPASPTEQARHAIDRINGFAGKEHPAAASVPSAASAR
ncbi:hypothetical protein ACWCP6_32040 [Streptomyces sp. NPDC002004]